jgi:ribosome maturation factor RimP
LAWIEIKGPRSGRRVRVFIERTADTVGLADCERVNEKLSALLDLEDPIPGSYTLEVSTPGLDRPLRSAEECRRFLGRRVRIRHQTESRPHTVTGTLGGVNEDGVLCLSGPDGERRIAWSAVVAARLAPDLASLFGRRPAGRRRPST